MYIPSALVSKTPLNYVWRQLRLSSEVRSHRPRPQVLCRKNFILLALDVAAAIGKMVHIIKCPVGISMCISLAALMWMFLRKNESKTGVCNWIWVEFRTTVVCSAALATLRRLASCQQNARNALCSNVDSWSPAQLRLSALYVFYFSMCSPKLAPHTYLTHSYLLRHETPPEYDFCHICLTVEHLVSSCCKYTAVGRKFYNVNSLQELFDRVKPRVIVTCIKEIGLYRKF
jgi:hypothetical protein